MDSTVLVIDHASAECLLLEEMIKSWGLKAHIIDYSFSLFPQIRESDFDVLLLDLDMPEPSGTDLISRIGRQCSDTRIIAMSDSVHNETAASALQAGAFALLNKPIDKAIAYHAVHHALEDLEKRRQLLKMKKELQEIKAELLYRQEQVELLNNQLIDTNTALSVVAQNMEHERSQMENRIAARLRSLIVPSIQRLQNIQSLQPYKADLDMMLYQLEDLSSTFSTDSIISSTLSPCELRIASLIKHGVTTEAIARQLHVSPATVRTHRKNIRRKLRMNGTNYSLRSYLQLPPENKKSGLHRFDSLLTDKKL